MTEVNQGVGIGAYLSDEEISDPKRDKFRRYPFANRIAETIATRVDPSCIVIGLYGEWGEGKTTVIRFMEHELSKNSDIVIVRFNPWRFDNEEKLLRGFYDEIADSLNRSLANDAEKVGKWLKDKGALLAPLTSLVKGADAIEKIGTVLSTNTLEDLKKRIETFLLEDKKRIVIFIDDIDRLDKSEIQAVFRLVKLSADFKFATYVLAFDEAMVAAALEERYAKVENRETGRNFLEKIVQVPITLPKATSTALRRYSLEVLEEALKNTNVELDEEQAQLFIRYFSCLQVRLRTPRLAKRYANTITFSLPILRGEVNTVDLMLIEGVRVFYPELYDFVRDNPEIFVGSARGDRRHEELKKQYLERISAVLSVYSVHEQNNAKELLTVLFPKVHSIFGNTYYGDEFEKNWRRQKNVCSRHYFERYFSYAIPEGDVSDLAIEALVTSLAITDANEVALQIRSLIQSNAESVIQKLRERENDLTDKQSFNLALALSTLGDMLPHHNTLNLFSTPFAQSAILISHLVRNVSTESRLLLCSTVIQYAVNLPYMMECFSWIRRPLDNTGANFLMTKEEMASVSSIALDRLRSAAADIVFHRDVPRYARELYSLWKDLSSFEEVNTYILSKIKAEPRDVLTFVRAYVPMSWSLES